MTTVRRYPALAFTESVKATQERYGTRAAARKLETSAHDDSKLTAREAQFIAARDSFYVGSVSETGWPYVQFRGGPPGFLKVLDDGTLGFADFRGNLQYITTGNVRQDPRVSLFLIDYPNRRRLKIMARAEVHEATDRPDLIATLADPHYEAHVERAVLYRVEAFDWNCPQHITPRFTERELASVFDTYRERIVDLEATIRDLRARQPEAPQ
jgi:uncharacterized protein